MNQTTHFLNSFKPNYIHLYILLSDLIFYIITAPTIFLAAFIIKKKLSTMPLELLTPETVISQLEIAKMLASQVGSFMFIFLATVILASLITLCAWTISRGLIYTKLLEKKLTLHYFIRFLGLNFLFTAILFIFLMAFSSMLAIYISLVYAAIAVLLLIAYFTSLIYIKFTHTTKIFLSIGEGLAAGIKKLHKLLLPCILIIAVFLIATIILKQIQPNPFISVLLFSVFMTWARAYFIPIANKMI